MEEESQNFTNVRHEDVPQVFETRDLHLHQSWQSIASMSLDHYPFVAVDSCVRVIPPTQAPAPPQIANTQLSTLDKD
jgi:hypothetical protein